MRHRRRVATAILDRAAVQVKFVCRNRNPIRIGIPSATVYAKTKTLILLKVKFFIPAVLSAVPILMSTAGCLSPSRFR